MGEYKRNELNGNLIAALVAVLIFVIVGLVFWYRQSQREMALDMADQMIVAQTRARFVDDRPGAFVQPIANVQQPTTNLPQQNPNQMMSLVALPQSMTREQIVQAVSPAVVNISIDLDPEVAQANTPQPTTEDQLFVNQQLAQNNRGARNGGWGLGPGGELVCPQCGTRLPHQTGVPCFTTRCPRCGAIMQRVGAPRAGAPEPGSFTTVNAQQAGTGVIIHHDGFVLTNLHVVMNATNIYVTVSYNKVTQTYSAKIFDEFPEGNLAILKMDTTGNESFSHVTLGDSDSITIGDKVLAFADQLGPQQGLTFGEITNTNRTITVSEFVFNEMIQTNIPLPHEYSGGPLVNTRGEVIGINTSIFLPYVSDAGFAVPINMAKKEFAEFLETTPAQFQTVALPIGPAGPSQVAGCPVGGACPTGIQCPAAMPNSPAAQCPPGMACPATNAQCPTGLQPQATPGLPQMQNVALPVNVAQTAQPGNVDQSLPNARTWGIKAQTVNAVIQNTVGSPIAFGVVVTQVDPRSQIEGLQRGDIIVRVDGMLVRTSSMFWKLLKEKAPGSKVDLAIFRAGDKVNVEITIPVIDLLNANPLEAGLLGPETLALSPVNQPAAVAGNFQTAAVGVQQAPYIPNTAVPQAPYMPNSAAPAPYMPGAVVDPATLPLRGILTGAEVEAGTIGLGNGLSVEELTPATAAANGLPANQGGLLVGEVEGTAQTDGFTMGDLIQKVNDKQVYTLADFITVMNEADPQAGATLEISRRGSVLKMVLR
ncbi:MAG: trypsin-like peptidase domain-containing protein [Candidatus Riflebacteria bacterium]|nr:trypsin-like peptidase domain-containing protein [Candidatus Riflebacteria bacterium]